MPIIEYVKEHPYLSGTLAVGLVVVFFVVRRGGSSGGGTTVVAGGGPSESLQAMGLQAGAAVQAAQIQATTQVAGYNAQVNMAELYYATDAYKAGLDQRVNLEYIFAAKDVALANTDASLQLGLAQVGRMTEQPVIRTGGPDPYEGSIIYGQGTSQQQAAVQQAIQAGAITSGVASMQTYGGGRPAVVVGSGGGQRIHGVEEQPNYGTLDTSIAQANMAAVQASYDQHQGSYLGNGLYAGSPTSASGFNAQTWAVYGDPRYTYQEAIALGYAS